MNRVVLVGRLTRNPELRRTNSDVPVVSFSIAVEDRAKDASGNKTVNFAAKVHLSVLMEDFNKELLKELMEQNKKSLRSSLIVFNS